MAKLFTVTRFPTTPGTSHLSDALKAPFDTRQSQLSQ